MKPYRGCKSLLPQLITFNGRGLDPAYNWLALPCGVERRKMILAHLERIRDDDHYYMTINKKYCPILKRDKDLQRLLKQGKVKMIKVRESKKTTYSALVINKGPDNE